MPRKRLGDLPCDGTIRETTGAADDSTSIASSVLRMWNFEREGVIGVGSRGFGFEEVGAACLD